MRRFCGHCGQERHFHQPLDESDSSVDPDWEPDDHAADWREVKSSFDWGWVGLLMVAIVVLGGIACGATALVIGALEFFNGTP